MKTPPIPPAPDRLEKTSFSFYPADVKIVADLRRDLAGCGLKVDRTKVIRCLYQASTEAELFQASTAQHALDEAKKPGPRETDLIVQRFTIDLPSADLDKFARVEKRLARQAIRMSGSYIFRARLRRLPPLARLLPVFQQYLARFPDGRTHLARVRAGRSHA
jgi:hypothetical protein